MIILFLSWQRYDFFLNLSLKYQIIYKGNTNQQRSNPFQQKYKHPKKRCTECLLVGNFAPKNLSVEIPARKYASEQTAQRHQHIGCNHIEEVETATRPQTYGRSYNRNSCRYYGTHTARALVMFLKILGYNLMESDRRSQSCQCNKQEEHSRPELWCRHILKHEWECFEYQRRALRRLQPLDTEYGREDHHTRQYRHQEGEH